MDNFKIWVSDHADILLIVWFHLLIACLFMTIIHVNQKHNETEALQTVVQIQHQLRIKSLESHDLLQDNNIQQMHLIFDTKLSNLDDQVKSEGVIIKKTIKQVSRIKTRLYLLENR
jgi:hypothetical protein